MLLRGGTALVGILCLLQMQSVLTTECPLDLSGSNFTLAASMCSKQAERGKCCRYINAFVAVSISNYANSTGNLGVPPELSETCLQAVSQTLEFYGIAPNAMVSCGLGTKIPVNYECKGRTTVTQMLESPKFGNVTVNCKLPLSGEGSCRRCLNAGILYLHHLVGMEDNMTLSTCRDATFVSLTSNYDNMSALEMASCFFGIQGLVTLPEPSTPSLAPVASPPPLSAPPVQNVIGKAFREHRHPYHLTLVPAIGISVTGVAVLLLIVLILLIRKKSKELNGSGGISDSSRKAFSSWSMRKCQEGSSSMFRRFSYKETKKATGNFGTVIGKGGFGTVYKAEFSDGFVAAVKRMNKVSEQGEDEFCREMELLGRLHHRHLVALRGFCIEKQERFLMYEYMENGSLKDCLHSPEDTPLSWKTRVQIAIDVANALEYLHFYCDPPLCHRDIKSSNILLDGNFVAKVADFGLAHASRTGSINFEPVNTDIRGTPGYMDPEYVVTQELTEKSDVYSYGVLLLELVTGKKAIHENKNLVEWSQKFLLTDSRLSELVDPALANSFNFEQLQTVVRVIRWCTQKEGRARPSIKQVLRLLHERLDPVSGGLVEALEEEENTIYKGKVQRGDPMFHSGDGRCLQSSSSTSRSYCSRSFLLETASP
ncbi:hypothetical protein H6P81_015327 [Aristolochia fimbriata]|uniref:Protein kinase domain-containing protein n=1 Tax=Aristolochia fimbriata TaxID=158543 RepID=A0AAV7E8A8_ARIFI|nr:hypothetical protein H6P81_015327 [Aristolochia fimbriata]